MILVWCINIREDGGPRAVHMLRPEGTYGIVALAGGAMLASWLEQKPVIQLGVGRAHVSGCSWSEDIVRKASPFHVLQQG